jgi:anti-sigma-K factor RskA
MPTLTETKSRDSAPTWVYLVIVAAVVVLAAVFLGLRPSNVKPGIAQVDANNTLSRMAVCFSERHDYTRCDTNAELKNDDATLVRGTTPAPGEVSVVTTRTSYDIRAADSHDHLWEIVSTPQGFTDAHVCLQRNGRPCPELSW